MKVLLAATTLTAAFLMFPALADHHMKDHLGKWDEKRMQMHNDEMEAHLQDMQALMQKLHATSNPAERRRLLEEHREEMAELMENMRSSREDMVMGMMGGGARRGGPMPEGEKRRQYMIEKRLDMMDHAMEMMLQRDEMMMMH